MQKLSKVQEHSDEVWKCTDTWLSTVYRIYAISDTAGKSGMSNKENYCHTSTTDAQLISTSANAQLRPTCVKS